MSRPPLPPAPHLDRRPAHPSITADQIGDLVDLFYGRVREDTRLGPIFATHVGDDWDHHLPKMKAFWRSVLLRTGEYKGKPVPKHVKLTEVVDQDFSLWLDHFQSCVADVFDEEARPIVVDAARRIASSLWMALNPNTFTAPPDWSGHSTGSAEASRSEV